MNPFKGKESKAEESKEKAKFKTKAAYKQAEKKFEGEKMACGGKVKKMAAGGKVCRGGGAATRGIKFKGVK